MTDRDKQGALIGEPLEGLATRTENDAVIAVAQQATTPHVIVVDGVADFQLVGVPEAVRLERIDTRDLTDAPRRKKGGAVLQDAASFVAYVKRHKTDATVIYANQDAGTITAVLNDHATKGAGWGDFRAVLRLTPTDEWEHWISNNDKLLTQIAFAEHIEDGLLEIVKPPSADMLELAQHFQAHSKVDYKSDRLLQSGQRQFVYEETIEAKAGATGEIKIPRDFELGIAPYEGSDTYSVVARLRYRLTEGKLTIGYALVRPHDVLRDAFNDVLKAVQAGTDAPVVRGSYGL